MRGGNWASLPVSHVYSLPKDRPTSFASSPICPRLACFNSETPAAAATLLQSCPTLCNSIDGSPLGSSVPGILQARILEWVAISFSNACMHARLLQPDSVRPYGQQPTSLLCPQDSPGKNTGVGCPVLLRPETPRHIHSHISDSVFGHI